MSKNENFLFKGEIEKIDKHVFQKNSQRENKSQFNKKVDTLRLYFLLDYTRDTKSLNVLFTGLKKTSVENLDYPKQKEKMYQSYITLNKLYTERRKGVDKF